MPYRTMFLTAVALTILAGLAATWLAILTRNEPHVQKSVAERLAHIAMLGAATIFALLSSGPE